MYKMFTKTDGLRIFLRPEDIIGYEETEDGVLVKTVIEEYEVTDTIEMIFNISNKNVNFSKN